MASEADVTAAAVTYLRSGLVGLWSTYGNGFAGRTASPVPVNHFVAGHDNAAQRQRRVSAFGATGSEDIPMASVVKQVIIGSWRDLW